MKKEQRKAGRAIRTRRRRERAAWARSTANLSKATAAFRNMAAAAVAAMPALVHQLNEINRIETARTRLLTLVGLDTDMIDALAEVVAAGVTAHDLRVLAATTAGDPLAALRVRLSEGA